MNTVEVSVLLAGIAGLCLALMSALVPAEGSPLGRFIPSFCTLSGLDCPVDRIGN